MSTNINTKSPSSPIPGGTVPSVGGVVARMVAVARSVQFKNAPQPILVTLAGMVMLVKPVQLPNALLPIVVTLAGMVTLVKPVD